MTAATLPRRIAIVNRGEPAMRLIHAVRELEHEHPQGVVTVALHTEAERGAMFVREADEAVRIGPGPGEPVAGNPYLDLAELERALTEARADAAWVGWGFVAENAAFADLCERIGVVFVGPSGAVMRRLGDKIEAKLLAERAGVPVAPWSGGAVESVEDARRSAEDIGYPLAIKATAGGGGRGIRVVRDPDDLDLAFERARDEARRSFGDPTVFMERLLTGARHVEVQIIADGHGGVWAAGVRDCSIQRRNQKVLEESASTALSPDQEAQLRAAATELVRAAEYANAGTVEFLYQPEEQMFAFLEVNPRLQVEHTVTELVTGLDIVKLQLHVAGGGRLEGDTPPARGHAIQVRLNAEDVERGFTPSPGTIELLALPAGPGVRVDSGFAEGDVIPAEYDSMIAKILAWGRDRSEALGRLGRALAQTTVLVRGGTTNRAFLLDCVAHPDVVAGNVDTGWLDRLTADGGYTFRTRADVALVDAAIAAFDAEAEVDRSRFYAAAARGRPEASPAIGHTVDLRHAGVAYRFAVARTGPSRYEVVSGDDLITAEVERLRRFERRLFVGDERYRILSIAQGPDRLVEVDGIPHRISQDDAGLVRTPGPGLVVALTTAVGDEVEAGSALAVLECMKMETVLAAPFTGRVREILASANTQLDTGTPVLRLEPIKVADDEAAAAPVDLGGLSAASAGRRDEPVAHGVTVLDEMRRLVLGYDVAPDVAGALADDLERIRQPEDAGDTALLDAEIEVLQIFADLTSLSRNRRIGDEEDRQEAHAAREYLHAYLRSLDVEAERLPDSFRAKLERALAHYGIGDLERTPDLEDALYRIHLAQQRTTTQLPVILGLLDRRLRSATPPDGGYGDRLRETLDQLIRATQVRHPVVGDLARRARYRCFDQPRLDRDRLETDERGRAHLAALVERPDAPDRDEHIAALVADPQPLLGMLGDPAIADGGLHPMLEVLTRHYYRTRSIEEVRSVSAGTHEAVVADVVDRRGHGRVVAIATSRPALGDALLAAHELTADLPEDHGAGAAADVYVTWADPPADADRLAAELAEPIGNLPAAVRLRRITLSVTTASADGSGPTVRHLTFRRASGAGFVERRHLRDIHPLVAGRLNLWRFERFELTRLPSTDDVYLFRGVAREHPDDERLFAIAEVRDLTPVRGHDGRVTSLPELERVFTSCIADLRQARATYPHRGRPEWNRVLLYVWPPVDVPIAEVDPVVRALAPMTEDLGLELVMVQARLATPDGGLHEAVVRMHRSLEQGLTLRVTEPPAEPLAPLDELTQKVLRARRRGTVYPYELPPLLTERSDAADLGPGAFVEHDLDEDGHLSPVERPYGRNAASVVVGTVTTPTRRYPEGMTRVGLFSDPTKGLGALAEAECRRIIAALDLAEEMAVPVEWFAVSSGARIAMDSGTENMDWIGRVLRRIIQFTQTGGEINVVVTGINVGAQPYWNAEATMLTHTRGILVMTPGSAMVLTGKQALDYSGGVSAEDNFGIGGYDRVMGPNGQAQYWAPDLAGAIDVLFAHYDHTYVAPGERFPRRAATEDPVERDVRSSPHEVAGIDFTRVGDIFDEHTNPGRKKPFDIRTLMHAVADADHPPLERWADMADADTAVALDAHVGGYPVAMLGFESRPTPRPGLLPADGPDQWTAGTLFPQSSKKTARAINAASGNRPLVVLANLSGFDGSPESLQKGQLEFGAEIGRAVVNFAGPIVFCVVSRYHGGAFVVFSATLNDDMEIAAVEGSHASVIGGPPAAAVVFAGEVTARTERDPRVSDLEERRSKADDTEAVHLQAELDEVRLAVRSEKLGEVAAEFDAVHSVERARDVGSIDTIIPAERLRPYVVDAVERGIRRAEAGGGQPPD